MTEEQKKQIIRLRKKGCGYTAVANKAGISKDTVKSFCKRNGLAGEMAVSAKTQVPGCRECGRPLQQMEGNKEQFRAERLYLTSLSVAKSMLHEGIISENEFAEIDTILLKKYRPILGTLLAGKPLV